MSGALLIFASSLTLTLHQYRNAMNRLPAYKVRTNHVSLEGFLPRNVLEKIFNEEEEYKPTAWQLNGAVIVEDDQKYMAISHVWSDGTGAGAWDGLKVNKCLYYFFQKVS